MTVVIVHAHHTTIPDDGSDVGATQWNAGHLVTGLATIASTGAEADLIFTDITTGNASTGEHGFLPKLDGNAGHYLDGTGSWSSPPLSGAAGGDLAGSYPNPTLAWISHATGKTLTVDNTLTFTGTDGSSVAFGAGGTVLYANQTVTLSGDVTGSGATAITTTVAAIAGTTVSGTTGSGNVVFATSPALTTPNIGAATATSVNKVTITAPASSATLTIANSKTLTVSNTLTLTGTDGSSVAFGAGGTVLYANQTITLSGDVSGSGTTAITATLASVASAGTTGSSTAIPVVTINAKGLTTSITTAAVIAPAGTLSGATLASGVTASSLTSLGTLTALTVAGNIAQTSGTFLFLGTTSGTNTMTVAASPALTALTTNAIYLVKIGTGNTSTTPTLNINSLGAKTIVKRASTALASGDLVANAYYWMVYDGTNLHVLNPTVP